MADQPLRVAFAEQLDQLRLQVELMAVRVDQNLERMRTVLETGDLVEAERAVNADDDVDAMLVSLTERCYDLLCLEAPMASDLRLVVSVLRVLSELERIGDLALRVIKLAPDQPLLAAHSGVFDILLSMAAEAIELYRVSLRAWSARDLDLATGLARRDNVMDAHFARLMGEIFRLEGVDAVEVAVKALTAGRSLERIADHTVIIGARVRYLLTGDPAHLSVEVR
ncbi:MAG: phosphate signaling complex protein PhoU [Acidimicrobiales bacterium]|nr:phosphate signaling complex protein PhoU [Acidimicrobiales bacterium]